MSRMLSLKQNQESTTQIYKDLSPISDKGERRRRRREMLKEEDEGMAVAAWERVVVSRDQVRGN